MRILYLAKAIETRTYAEDILDGHLYLNSLSYYKEREQDDGKKDPNEGSWLLQRDIIIECTINGHQFKDVKRVKSQDNLRDGDFLWCICIGHAGNLNENELTDDNLNDYRKQIGFPGQRMQEELNSEYTVLFFDGGELIERIVRACERKGYDCEYGPVRYYDPEVDSVTKDIIFSKTANFSYQQEFRFVVTGAPVEDDHLRLDVGDLRDISVMMKTEMVNSSLCLQVRDRRSGEIVRVSPS